MAYGQIEDLRILQKAEEISDIIWKEVVKWDYFSKDTVGRQLIKAADSVGANIVESQGRFHPKEVINFLYISRGSLREIKFWTRKSFKRTLFTEEKYKKIVFEIDNLVPQINAFIKNQEKRINSKPNKLSNYPTIKL